MFYCFSFSNEKEFEFSLISSRDVPLAQAFVEGELAYHQHFEEQHFEEQHFEEQVIVASVLYSTKLT